MHASSPRARSAALAISVAATVLTGTVAEGSTHLESASYHVVASVLSGGGDAGVTIGQGAPIGMSAGSTHSAVGGFWGATGTTGRACIGDCDGGGDVTIDEVLRGVNIALGSLTADACPVFDGNADAAVTVDEIIAAVGNALNGCGAIRPPTVTPTVGTTPLGTATPTPSRTQSQDGTVTPSAAERSIAGGGIAVANAAGGLSAVGAAIAAGFQFGDGTAGLLVGSDAEGGAAGACPMGGVVTRTCQSDFPSVTVTRTLSACALTTASGALVADGTIVLTGTGSCGTFVPFAITLNVKTSVQDHSGNVVLTTTAKLTGPITPLLGGTCVLSGASVRASGSLETERADGQGIAIAFHGTTIDLRVATFTPECAPVVSTMTLNGLATISDTLNRRPLRVTFSNFVLAHDASSADAVIRMDGGLDADCFGGEVTIQTVTPLRLSAGAACPTSGVLRVISPNGSAQVAYLGNGGIDIDANLDGRADEAYASCLDVVPLVCADQPVGVTFRKIADSNTSIPGGSGTFVDFFYVALDNSTVAFSARGAAPAGSAFPHTGVYVDKTGRLEVVADVATDVPGPAPPFGGKRPKFTSFESVSLSADDVAFEGFYHSNSSSGVYNQGFIFGGDQVREGLRRVADSSSTVPGDPQGRFDAYSSVSFDAFDVAFAARTAFNRTGIYAGIEVIADTHTLIPGGIGNFERFAIDGQPVVMEGEFPRNSVVFQGSGASGQRGVYGRFGRGGLQVVADTHTSIPGGLGTFTDACGASLRRGLVAFVGTGANPFQKGVYTDRTGGLSVVADRATPMPGGPGTFRNFECVTSSDHAYVAFEGAEDRLQYEGIYVDRTGALLKIIATDDVLDGKTVRSVRINPESLSSDEVAFVAEFRDGSKGIYVGRFPLRP